MLNELRSFSSKESLQGWPSSLSDGALDGSKCRARQRGEAARRDDLELVAYGGQSLSLSVSVVYELVVQPHYCMVRGGSLDWFLGPRSAALARMR